jgi:phage baseplate assembly protein W
MTVTRVSRAFKDISLSFVPHPVTNDLPVLTNQNSIIRSIRNLIETIPTEVFFNSLIGSNVRSTLFDFIDSGTASVIEDEIRTTIFNYEPRVNNVRIDVIPRPDDNAFEVTVVFDIVGQDLPTQKFSFVLEAAR